ncbi:hypothetical protein [Dietzia maris]|uniref:hypothetical protein n=1 Tax=Dietzia maris TaxID=37915 RepID=UPI00104F8EB5|nr:hypothetical protein [Dietzia maris]
MHDPFMDGVEDLPLRLELVVRGINLDEPSFEETSRGWKVRHFKRLLEFESLNGEDDENEVAFNEKRIVNDAVFPVRVRLDTDQNWRGLYMRVSDTRRILRKIGGRYECVPDPTFAREFMNVWQILDTDFLCAECVRNVRHRDQQGQISRGRRVQVSKYLLRTLCKSHESEFNSRAAASRQR